MRKMKDSGLQWIGNIPEEWTVGRVKDVISLLTDYTANGSFGDLAKNVQYLDDGYARLVRLTDLRENLTNANGIFIDEPTFNYLAKSKLKSGDILVANVGAYSGLFCEMPKVEYPCSLAPNMFLIRTNKRMIQHFLFYVGSSNFVWEQLVQKAVSSAQPKLNKTDIKTTFLPIPPIDEQKKIADFLDEKCGEIDSIRSDIQKQIDILNDYKKSVITEAVTGRLEERTGFRSTDERREKKWKDSRIPRIGKIPVEWGTSRIKYVCSVIGSGTTPSSGNVLYYEGSENWIQSGDLYKKKYITETEKTVTDYAVSTISALHKYKADFIVIAMYGASIGNVAISKIDACVNQACCVIKPNSKVNFNYLYYTLINDKDIMLDMSIGGTQPNISQAKILELPVLLPPLPEQKAIADYLDEKCSEIDATIADKQRQLETLDEYKKSLIFEYVTGKKEVLQ